MASLSGISFRTATPADALCIAVLGTQVFLDTYAPQGIRPSLAREVVAHFSAATVAQQLAAPSRVFILAEHDGHLIGFAQLAFGVDHALVPFAPAAELERLYVQERRTSGGIGKTLLGHAEELAAARGMAALWLTAWIGNARALSFYSRRGYQALGATQYVFENEAYENRLFAKRLPRAAA
ncbi:MAG TPA: GNAT family N-acetyltransferase [Paucimonas sp.]|nr:GNAT family N-acetyltransferase [Paucimonas sp.]